MNRRRLPIPPPWCLILLGTVFLYWAYDHYLTMVQFEEGQIDRLYMHSFMILLYETTGFWPTVILPFVGAAAIAFTGVSLQIRDIRCRIRGETGHSYEPVRLKGILTALLVVVVVISVCIGLAFLLKV